jgi:tRNA G18 (ribose-2'-O)-methylase SpoU
MDMIRIDSLDDPRVAVYRDLKERELARDGGRFIAESEHVVKRLLASDFEVESVLVTERRAEEMLQNVTKCYTKKSVTVYVVPDELVHSIVGFKFHSGVIACGRRKTGVTLEEVLPGREGRSLVVICPDLISHENLGSLIRSSSAFGADGMILGPRCCDPFYRMCIRVSMGTVFSLPIYCSQEFDIDLGRVREEWGYELVATVLSEDAESLEKVKRGERIGVLFGNEAQGLAAEHSEMCDRRVTIPMKRGTDSLNVAVAAGIFLYELARG